MAAGTKADDALTPHGILLTAKWDWTTSANTGRWSTPQQAIKPRRWHIPTSATDPYNDGFGVLKSRLRLRGKGESLSVRFESQPGKDFQIVGMAIPYQVETSE